MKSLLACLILLTSILATAGAGHEASGSCWLLYKGADHGLVSSPDSISTDSPTRIIVLPETVFADTKPSGHSLGSIGPFERDVIRFIIGFLGYNKPVVMRGVVVRAYQDRVSILRLMLRESHGNIIAGRAAERADHSSTNEVYQ